MNKHKDKSNGSEQKGATAVAERGTERSDGHDEILAYRRPLVSSGWMGDAFPMVRRLADEFDRVFEGFGFGSNSLWGNSPLRSPWSTDAGTGSWMPPVEVVWRGDRLVVRAELPGRGQGRHPGGGNGWSNVDPRPAASGTRGESRRLLL